jgi:hypothetical protein
VKGIIFGKNIPIECMDYPTHKIKQFRVLILTVDLAPLFHCRKNPSKKVLLKNQKKTKNHLISRGYMTQRKLACDLLISVILNADEGKCLSASHIWEALLSHKAVIGKEPDEIFLDIDASSDCTIFLFCNTRLFFGCHARMDFGIGG